MEQLTPPKNSRQLPHGTPVVLNNPYSCPVTGIEFSQGRIHEYLGPGKEGKGRYGLTFEGFDGTVDFNRNEFVLARSGT